LPEQHSKHPTFCEVTKSPGSDIFTCPILSPHCSGAWDAPLETY